MTDIEAVVAWVRHRHQSTKIVLYGQSMGASLSLVAASRTSDISGVIADSPYISQKSVVELINARRAANDDPRVVTYVGGASLDPVSHVKKLKSTALLLIHGRNEKTIPPSEVSAFYKKYPSKRKELWLVDGADYLQSMAADPLKYAAKVERFVKGISSSRAR